MFIKYLHFNNTDRLKRMSKSQQRKHRSSTVAVQPLSYDEFKKASLHLDYVTLNIGITKVHPNDNYTKVIGRTYAFNKMKPTDINIESVTFNKTHVFINLEEFEGISLTLRYNKQTNHSTVLG